MSTKTSAIPSSYSQYFSASNNAVSIGSYLNVGTYFEVGSVSFGVMGLSTALKLVFGSAPEVEEGATWVAILTEDVEFVGILLM